MNLRTWQQYLPEARQRVAESRLRVGPADIRCEEPAAQGQPTEGQPGGGGAVDLSNPAVTAAIAEAVAREQAAAAAREAGLKRNRDELLAEKDKWKLGESPEAVKAKLQRLEELETEVAAKGVGVETDKFKLAVEEAAQKKYLMREKELAASIAARDQEIAELKTAKAGMEREIHRSFVAEQIVRASVPNDIKVVHDGAWPTLLQMLEPIVVAQEVPGLGKVARLKINDTLVPGSAPDKLMDLRELLSLSRAAQGPMPDIGFCLVSGGRGTGTQTPGDGTPGAVDWNKLDVRGRAEYTSKFGAKAAQEQIDRAAAASAAA